jgi:hypothetical protein
MIKKIFLMSVYLGFQKKFLFAVPNKQNTPKVLIKNDISKNEISSMKNIPEKTGSQPESVEGPSAQEHKEHIIEMLETIKHLNPDLSNKLIEVKNDTVELFNAPSSCTTTFETMPNTQKKIETNENISIKNVPSLPPSKIPEKTINTKNKQESALNTSKINLATTRPAAQKSQSKKRIASTKTQSISTLQKQPSKKAVISTPSST